MSRPERLVYLGTPELAVPPLRGLHDAGFDIVSVITRPDRRRGRGATTTPSPVKAAAVELGLPVSHDLDDVIDAGADLGVVVAYGRLIGRRQLEALDFVNLHYSLLPRWRGAAPIERAILAGDTETGVCLMALEETLDTGPVHARVTVPIEADTTLASLRAELTEAAVPLLVNELAAGLGTPEPQQGEPTYAHKLTADDFALDWRRPAAELERVVRLGAAFTGFRGKRLKVLEANVVADHDRAPGELTGEVVGTGAGGLRLVRVQPEGKGPMAATAWRNGARPEPDERLATP